MLAAGEAARRSSRAACEGRDYGVGKSPVKYAST
jgi:hypothetical protein